MTTALVQRGSLAKIKDETVYYQHQADGVRDLARRSSFLLADEMGLGKSLQALTVAAIDFEAGVASRVLIVAPASLKWNWQTEIETHTRFTSFVLDGTPARRRDQLARFALDGCDILIVNYEQVITHLNDLNHLGFDIVIFDEAHYIKSHRAKRTRACHGLTARRFFLLTGSPLLNQIDDLWSLLHRIDPASYPGYWKFLARYAVFGGYRDKQVIGVKNHAELSARLDQVMLRREKKNVLDLPAKMRIPIYVDLHPEQARLYKQAQDELMLTLPDGAPPLELENALTKLLRLKQICGTTATIGGGHADHSTKLDVAVERVVEIVSNGEPVVIFTQFRTVLACMKERLDLLSIPTWSLHGGVPASERVGVVGKWERAAQDGEPGAMLAMLQVAGVGLNMTAASKCIFLDKLWVPKLNEQAEDRLHRIGASTTKPIEIIDIICRKTVEQRVELILRRKEKIFGAVVETDDWKRRLLDALANEGDEA